MKTILVHVEDDAGQESRLQAAFDLGRDFGAHLVFVSVMPYAAYAMGDPNMGAFPVTTLVEAVETRRREQRQHIEARLPKEGVSWEWRNADGDAADRLAEAARLADLVVMSAGPFGAGSGGLATTGDTAIRAPAAVLAVPPRATGFHAAGPAVVCWDGSQEAALAMRAAIPMLRAASSVHLLTVAEKDSDYPARAAAAYLSRHEVAAEIIERGRGGASVEQVIRSVIAETGATWAVQGAYGHSRLRQTLFGGVTRGLLSDAPVPLLLAH